MAALISLIVVVVTGCLFYYSGGSRNPLPAPGLTIMAFKGRMDRAADTFRQPGLGLKPSGAP